MITTLQTSGLIPRLIASQVQRALDDFPAIVVTGARQTGKTTLLRNLFPQATYVSLDRPSVAEQAEQDPEAFLSHLKEPVIIDEVQYAPSIFRFLKIKIDDQREMKGRFLLTGSQRFSMMAGITESLAGRIGVLNLEGLSVLELQAAHKVALDNNGIEQLLLRGGFPELWQDTSRSFEMYLDAYIATHLQRDVKQVLSVTSLRDFERFLRACALRSGQQLNKSNLARDVGISVSTAGEWLTVLEALGHITLLEPWFGNLTKRLVKAPKLYVSDPSLMAILCGISSTTLWNSPLIGALWETFVFAELRKQISFYGQRARLWYYRDQSKNEVDFIIERGHQLTLYDAKWTSSPHPSLGGPLHKVSEILTQSSHPSLEVVKRMLVTRSSEVFTGQNISFCSPWKGLLG